MVGIFPPNTLISPPCTPKTFDFYTVAIEQLMDFEIPISFVASRTAVMHGLASWFDLDFEASPSAKVAPSDPEASSQWDEYLALSAWPWMSTEPPLNPNDQPRPPSNGVKVTLSTGPNAPRTHWQ